MFGLIGSYQKVSKTFVFENEQTQQSAIQDLEIDFGQELINLNHVLHRYCPLKSNKITIYEPNSNSFVSLKKIGAECGIFHKNLIEPSVILIRYRTKPGRQHPVDATESNYSLDSEDRKDMRSRERTVAEAIDLVKRWRNLHLNCTKPNNNKKKINLQEAARMLDVSKKSLDDYYCQLRLAEMHGFDFEKNLHEKMGVLRAYVKDSKQQQEMKKLKPHRHPKNLKIIEDCELEARILMHLSKRTGQKSVGEVEMKGEEPLNAKETEEVQEMAEINNLEHQFFRGFEFLLDDPADPFLTLNKDFNKKMIEEESDGILFY